MILFFGHYPEPGSGREGSAQRLLGIDQLFQSEERVYVRFIHPAAPQSLPRKRAVEPNVTLYVLKKSRFEDMTLLGELMSRARLIYIHSIYWAQDLMEFLDEPMIQEKLVFDAHGVVPEEERSRGRGKRATVLEEVEKKVLASARLVITVTEAMAEHFRKKYPALSIETLVLPMFSTVRKNKASRDKVVSHGIPVLVYAGGAQEWQNIDLMVDLVGKLAGKAEFQFLTPDVKVFQKKLKEKRLLSHANVASLPREEVEDVYARSDFGLVLRDDLIVNRVACPTKLIEYFEHRLIPIVQCPNIGDFSKQDYAFVSLKDACAGRFPNAVACSEMAEKNFKILMNFKNGQSNAEKKLRSINSSFIMEAGSTSDLHIRNRILEVELQRLRNSRIGRIAEWLRGLLYWFMQLINRIRAKLLVVRKER